MELVQGFLSRLYDAIPDASSCSNTDGNGNLCSPGEELLWGVGTLPAGESRTYQIYAPIAASLVDGTLITVPVSVEASGLAKTQMTEKSLTVYNTPTLQFRLGAEADAIAPGNNFSYQLDIGNAGASAINNTVVRMSLPSGVSFVSTSDGGTQEANGDVVWTLGSVAAGVHLNRTITLQAGAGLGDGTILNAHAELTHDGGLDVDQISEKAVTVQTAQQLAVAVTAVPNPVVSGEVLSYEITVSNVSAASLSSVWLYYRIPAEISPFSRTTDVVPSANYCVNTDGNGNLCSPGEELQWSPGTLAPGESQTLQINAPVAAGLANGTLITVPMNFTVAELLDQIVIEKTVAIHNTPALQLRLGVEADAIAPGSNFSYQLDIGNAGASAVNNAVVRMSLPSGASFVSASDGGTQEANGDVVWTLGSVAAGIHLNRTITLQAGAGLGDGTILNAHAELTHDGGLEVDQVAEKAVTVQTTQQLAVAVTAVPNPVVSGEVLSYEITVSNVSATSLSSVWLYYRIPEEISAFSRTTDVVPSANYCVSNDGNGNLCSPGEELQWSPGTLAPGESQTLQINAPVAAGLTDGTLITVPISVTATGLMGQIVIEKTVAVSDL